MSLLERNPTRIHLLKSPGVDSVYIKRDDELGGVISGSKVRKFDSLIPWIINQGFNEVFVVGGQCSNNVLGLSYALAEKGLMAKLFLLKANDPELSRNWRLLKILYKNSSSSYIHLIDREIWPKALTELQQNLKSDKSRFVIPEGAFCKASVKGALSLGKEIFESSEKQGIQNVFLDSGTGLSAAAAIVKLEDLGFSGSYYVTQLAPLTEGFGGVLRQVSDWAEISIKNEISERITLMKPPTAASFGSRNTSLTNFMEQFIQREGVLLDPIYSGKHFMASLELIKNKNLIEPSLIVHSGGLQTL